MVYDETKNGNTAADTESGDSQTWDDETNVLDQDDDEAVNYVAKYSTSNYLDITNFLFNVTHGSTILGIEATVRRRVFTGAISCNDDTIQLLKNGAPVGNNKASGSLWPYSLENAVYGGSSDLWGTTWTWEDVVNTNFGIRISCSNGSGVAQYHYIAYVTLKIYYDGPGGRQKSEHKGAFLGISKGIL